MHELFVDEGALIDGATWERAIEALRTGEVLSDTERATQAVANALDAAVSPRAGDGCGVLLSGGIDSTTIAFLSKSAGRRFTCFSVGVEGARDLADARAAADMLGLNLITRTVSTERLEHTIYAVVRILGEPNVVKVGVGCVLYEALTLAQEAGVRVVLSGLGSEEIFAGYERHGLATDINEECWRGLAMMHERDLVRDWAIASHFGIEVRTPFLDPELIRVAMQVPGELKIVSGQKKVILRDAAVRLGLPKELAYGRKRAAQYGSGFDKALAKIAKTHGFAHKGDYLKSVHIAHDSYPE